MAKVKRRRKCRVCGLYVYGAKVHSGAIHARIMAVRKGRRR